MIFWVIRIFVLMFSVVFHEVAHGFFAFLLGDDTAKKSGRLSLNPIKHLDLVGSFLLPVILAVTNSPIMFGWAKPVPVDMSKVRESKKNIAIVSVVGPLVNISLVVLGISALHILRTVVLAKYGQDLYKVYLMLEQNTKLQLIALHPIFIVVELFFQLVFVNTALSVFNLIPIPPLDGSKLIYPFLNKEQEKFFLKLERYGILIIFLLLYFNVLNPIFGFVFNFVIKLIV